MARVHVSNTPSGFLPVMSWGEGADMDREAYAMSYRDLPTAERIARDWATQQGADYVEYQEANRASDPRMPGIVKQLREEHGLDLREAIAKAREIVADAPPA